jgi:hypothetical protein
VAALLVGPGVLWYHSLVPILPLVLCAWPRLSPRRRGLVCLGYIGVAVPMGVIPLFGAAVILATLLYSDSATTRTDASGLGFSNTQPDRLVSGER